jgi:uncharacterized protein
MSLKEQILEDFKNAFKQRDSVKKSVLAMVKSEIKNKEIELGLKDEDLKDEDVLMIIKKAIKQRREAMESFQKGGRDELAKNEELEIAVLEKYVPEQMSDEDLENELEKIVEESGADNLGKLMGMAMGKLKGKVDGSRVKAMAEKVLGKD